MSILVTKTAPCLVRLHNQSMGENLRTVKAQCRLNATHTWRCSKRDNKTPAMSYLTGSSLTTHKRWGKTYLVERYCSNDEEARAQKTLFDSGRTWQPRMNSVYLRSQNNLRQRLVKQFRVQISIKSKTLHAYKFLSESESVKVNPALNGSLFLEGIAPFLNFHWTRPRNRLNFAPWLTLEVSGGAK